MGPDGGAVVEGDCKGVGHGAGCYDGCGCSCEVAFLKGEGMGEGSECSERDQRECCEVFRVHYFFFIVCALWRMILQRMMDLNGKVRSLSEKKTGKLSRMMC